MTAGADVAAVIVAAGRGERAGQGDGPKQYRRIGGEPVLRHTLRAFARSGIVGPIVVVIHPDDEDRYREAVDGLGIRPRAVFGGATRQDSVREGLKALVDDAPEIVLIHDAARPFIDAATIARVAAAVDERTGIIPAMAVSDTLKRTRPDGRIEATVDRRNLFGAQTPQGFAFRPIHEAHQKALLEGRHDFTDDGAIAEWAGLEVHVVEGAGENVKLTLADDIVRAEERLRRLNPMIDVRTGNGYDVHQLVPGDHVTLCGVRIPSDQALSGHSDADVGLHALTDALLATCGAGDIGTHFPPSEERWRGAASDIFVRHAAGIVRSSGGRICNVDVTLIAEAPKIAPHRDAMREAIAAMTGLDLPRVSVKATTNETIGFVGRREGIAAIATASVVFGAPE